jgi:carbonic anhydrase
MDARIDALAVLGLELGDAHVLRNAGGRVTDDVVRSAALSATGFGTSRLVLMEHTECGAGIVDQRVALCDDVELLIRVPDLASIERIDAVLYDVATGTVETVVRWHRSRPDQREATPAKHGFATLRR